MKRNILIHTTLLLGIVLPAGLPLSAQEMSMTLTLEDCRQMAASRSSKATDASLDVLAAEYQKQEAFSEYFPRVSAVSFGFHSLDPMLKIGITDIVGASYGYSDIFNGGRFNGTASPNTGKLFEAGEIFRIFAATNRP